MCFAVAAVLQQESAQLADKDASLSLRLIADLLRRPKWLAGIAFLLAGFGLQALALSYGPVALVQPIIVTELAFAIPLAIWRRHRRAGRREWVGIAGVVAGVAIFLWAASPASGTPNPGGAAWLASLVPVGAVAAAAVLVGARRRDQTKPMFLGAAAGLAFGVLAVLTKATTYLLSANVGTAFLHWQPYAAIAVGIAALVVSQSAYQAGPLAYSLPFVDILEPVVAVVIGETVLGEDLHVSGGILAVEAIGGAIAAAGIVCLTTSKTVLSIYEETMVGNGHEVGEADVTPKARASGRLLPKKALHPNRELRTQRSPGEPL
jgi:drug/metabolite transporter (DMT)-like permease